MNVAGRMLASNNTGNAFGFLLSLGEYLEYPFCVLIFDI